MHSVRNGAEYNEGRLEIRPSPEHSQGASMGKYAFMPGRKQRCRLA